MCTVVSGCEGVIGNVYVCWVMVVCALEWVCVSPESALVCVCARALCVCEPVCP